MIRVTERGTELVQRLRLRAARIAAGYAAALRPPPRRTDWHSASALWPDLFGESRDGK